MNYQANGLTLNLKEQTNTAIFNELSTINIVKPKVPQFYYEQRDIFIENPDHPAYLQALEVYEAKRFMLASNIALLLAIEPDENKILQLRNQARYKARNYTDKQIWLDFLNNTLSNSDKANIINTIFLTENKVYDIFNMLATTIHRGAVEITEARLKNAINSQIHLDNIIIFNMQLVHPLDEYTACIESNMNWLDWENIDNTKRAEIIALFRIKSIVKNHSDDEVAIEMERKNKQN